MAGPPDRPRPLHQPEVSGNLSGGGVQNVGPDREESAGSPVPREGSISGAPATSGLDRTREQPSGVLPSSSRSSGRGLPQRVGAERRAPVREAEHPVDSSVSDTRPIHEAAQPAAAEPERKAGDQHAAGTREAAEPARRPAVLEREVSDSAAEPVGAKPERRAGDQPRATSGESGDIDEKASPRRAVSETQQKRVPIEPDERASNAPEVQPRATATDQRGEATHSGAEPRDKAESGGRQERVAAQDDRGGEITDTASPGAATAVESVAVVIADAGSDKREVDSNKGADQASGQASPDEKAPAVYKAPDVASTPAAVNEQPADVLQEPDPTSPEFYRGIAQATLEEQADAAVLKARDMFARSRRTLYTRVLNPYNHTRRTIRAAKVLTAAEERQEILGEIKILTYTPQADGYIISGSLTLRQTHTFTPPEIEIITKGSEIYATANGRSMRFNSPQELINRYLGLLKERQALMTEFALARQSNIPLVDLREQLDELSAKPGRHAGAAIPALERDMRVPINTDAAIAESHARVLEDQTTNLLSRYIPAIQIIKDRLGRAGEKVAEGEGYNIHTGAKDRRFRLPRSRHPKVAHWNNLRGNTTTDSMLEIDPSSSIDDFVLRVNIGDLTSGGSGNSPILEFHQRTGNDTTIQLAWDESQFSSQVLQNVFASNPELAKMIFFVESLGGNDAVFQYKIKIVISEAKPPSKAHPEGVPYSVTVSLTQENKITEDEIKLQKEIKSTKRWEHIAAGAHYAPVEMEYSSLQLEDELKAMRDARMHTVTYEFNPQENRFEGVGGNTSIEPDPISAKEFGAITAGLLSVIPTDTVDAVNVISEPVTILTPPRISAGLSIANNAELGTQIPRTDLRENLITSIPLLIGGMTWEMLKQEMIKRSIDFSQISKSLGDSPFSILKEPRTLDFVIVRVDQLTDEAFLYPKELLARGQAQGLVLCPPEVGVYMLLQYPRLWEFYRWFSASAGNIIVATKPIGSVPSLDEDRDSRLRRKPLDFPKRPPLLLNLLPGKLDAFNVNFYPLPSDTSVLFSTTKLPVFHRKFK